AAASSASATASADALNSLRHWSAAVRDALFAARLAARSSELLSERQVTHAVDFLNEHFERSDEQRCLVIWMLQNPDSVLGGGEGGGLYLELQES
ncbi:unnamed protein product, partial [Prorocentrum cordatum]